MTRFQGGFSVEDQDSRFGTFVNGARVRTVTVGVGDRIEFGSGVAYRVEAGGLRLDVAAGGIRLSASGLTVSAPRDLELRRLLEDFCRTTTAQYVDKCARREGKLLINDVNFHIRPDSFVGILGPSGAGKSTLLNCLASLLFPGQGRLGFDGGRDAFEEQNVYRGMLGHVPQDDVVFRALTIRENLAFAARLRLGMAAEKTDVAAAIDQALERVGLVEHSNNRVAILSGGQRKRLSVAIELLRRPRLLLLDEPTSGLDPASEAHLMEQLRYVARRGTTVVCTTHLMDNLRLLDEVVVLGVVGGVGRLAYVGPPDGLLPHFHCRRFADLYQLLNSGHFEPVVSTPGLTPEVYDAAADQADDYAPSSSKLAEPEPNTATKPTPRRVGIGQFTADWAADASWWQFAIMSERALLLVVRDRGLLLATLAQPLFLGLLVCLTQFDADKLLPLLFFAVVVAIWLGLNNSARDMVRDRRQYVRDRLVGLRPGTYLVSKAAVYAFVGTIQLLVLMLTLRLAGVAVFQFEHVAKDLLAFSAVWLFLILMISYLGGVGLGLLTSTLIRTEEAAIALLPLLIMPQLLISVVGTGVTTKRYEEERPFRPLIVTLCSDQRLPRPAAFVDMLSMACLSRPAVLVAEAPHMPGYGRWLWLGDFCHLLILLLAIWTAVLLAFGWAEQRWLRMIDL